MNNNKFYQFNFGGSNRDIHLISNVLDFDSYIKLSKGDLNDFQIPITFKQKSGKNWKDILCPSIGFHLISDRVKEALEANNITGYKTFPIIIYDKKGNEVPGYHGFSVTGRCDPTDWSKSEIIQKKLFEFSSVTDYYRGRHIDNWDGSDIFSPKGTLVIILSEKAYRLFKSLKLNSTRYIDIEKYEISTYTIIKR